MLAAIAWFTAAETAEAVVLTHGESFRIHFGFSEPPRSTAISGWAPDVLEVSVQAPLVSGFGFAAFEAKLYDGTELIGTYSSGGFSNSKYFAFTAPTSPYSFGAVDVMDFSSIMDGTIDGILEITMTSSSSYLPPLAFDFQVSLLGLARGLTSNSLHTEFPQPIIGSDDPTPIPEPSTALLFAPAILVGFAGWAGVGMRRMRGWRGQA